VSLAKQIWDVLYNEPDERMGQRIAKLANLPELYRWAAQRASFYEIPAAADWEGQADYREPLLGEEPQLPKQLIRQGVDPDYWQHPLPGAVGLQLSSLQDPVTLKETIAHELGHLLGFADIYESRPFYYFEEPFTEHAAMQRLLRTAPLSQRSLDLLRAQITAPVNIRLAQQLAQQALQDERVNRLETRMLAYLMPRTPYTGRDWLDVRNYLAAQRLPTYDLQPTIRLTQQIVDAVRDAASAQELAHLMREGVPFWQEMLPVRQVLPTLGAALENIGRYDLGESAHRVGAWLWNVGQFARLAGEVVPSIVAPIAAGALAQQIYKHFIRPRLVSQEAA
jgi:hypothetical protein